MITVILEEIKYKYDTPDLYAPCKGETHHVWSKKLDMTIEEFVNKYVKKIYRAKYLEGIKNSRKPEFGAKYLNHFTPSNLYYGIETNKNIEKDNLWHPHSGYGIEIVYEGNDDIDWTYSIDEITPVSRGGLTPTNYNNY